MKRYRTNKVNGKATLAHRPRGEGSLAANLNIFVGNHSSNVDLLGFLVDRAAISPGEKPRWVRAKKNVEAIRR